MGNRNKEPVPFTTTIDPDLKAWAKANNVNVAQIIRLVLQDLKKREFSTLNLREVTVEKRKDKALKLEGGKEDDAGTTE